MTSRRTVSVLLFLVLALPLCLWRLGANDVATMEGIVADGARFMADEGSFLVPRLHGEIYAYKPPLAYWLAALSFRVTDARSEWALRLPFSFSGLFLGLVVLMSVGRVLGYATGGVAALASISSVLTIQKLRLAEFDMPLAAGVGAAAALVVADLASDEASACRWLGAYASLAAGFLAKGAPALMFFVPGIAAAAVLSRRPRRLLSPQHLLGVLLFVVAVGGWATAAWIAEGWPAFVQPVAEAAEKGLGWTPSAVLRTLAKPVLVVVFFFPWTLALLGGLQRSTRAHLAPPARAAAAAAAGFVAGGLLAFMAVPADESRYLLPLSAPIGILAGVLVSDRRSAALRRFAGVSTLVAGLGVAAVSTATLLGWRTLAIDRTAGVVLVVGGTLTAVLGVVHLRRLAWPPVAALAATAFCLAGFHLLAIEPHRAGGRSLRPIADAFHRHLPRDAVLWSGPVSKGFHHSSLTFYLGRPIRTFRDRPPPPGAFALLFSDEPPVRSRHDREHPPFDFEPIAAYTSRGVRFALVRVGGGNVEPFVKSAGVAEP